ncbi:MAG: molybdopterin biosynthesis protein [Candidatus Eremiobacterota bacterium]
MEPVSSKLVEIPLEEALDRWFSELEFLGVLTLMDVEEVPTVSSVGRVTALPVAANLSSPHYYQAARDGMAVRSTTTFPATREAPVTLRLGSDGVFVDTGSALPDGFDAVVPVREIRLVSTEDVQIDRPSAPWRNVRPTGEDLAAREVILPRDRRIGALEVGAMLAGGVSSVKVYERPRVAILPLGSKLVDPGVTPGVGQMIDSNSPILAALISEVGARGTRLKVVPERVEEAAQALMEAVHEYDMVVVVAGPSHGTSLVAHLLADYGEQVLNGVAVKPGHSLTAGVIEGKPVLGLPFYPVSSYLTFQLFARPVLEKRMGLRPAPPVTHPANLAAPIQSPAGVEEFLRVKLGIVGNQVVAVPISRGAALLMSLVRSEGLVHVPAQVEGIPPGTQVNVQRLLPERPIEGNILLLGTHDITYNVLNTQLMKAFPDLQLFSAATGSTAGLEALRRGLCHIAAVHLFDPETSDYNIPHVARMDDLPIVLVNLFHRHIGLIVAPGNPKGLKGLADLTGEGVTFINRQVGSGTRFLLDHHLRQEGVDPSRIHGFSKEAFTHMSVAAAVSSGAVDAGPGIPAAAKALRLDFVPCFEERLDLAIPKRFYNLYPIQSLLQVVRSSSFRREATSHLAGYDFRQAGVVLWEAE